MVEHGFMLCLLVLYFNLEIVICPSFVMLDGSNYYSTHEPQLEEEERESCKSGGSNCKTLF